jgi:hypothetical protein
VQVIFPNPKRGYRAVVESVKSKGKLYTVRDIYSKFPSCDCKWADQGNFCKHQFKALLVRHHKEGNIVEALGTNLGFVFSGLAPIISKTCNSAPSKFRDGY